MMYWLIVFFFDPTNGDLLLRHEVAVKNKAVCEQVMKDYRAPKGFQIQKFCVSDAEHIKDEDGIFLK